MIRLQQDTPTGGDCTAGYKLILSEKVTVADVVAKALSSGEWGSIQVGGEKIEYKRGEIIGSNFSDKLLSSTIISGRASGGWSLMDYYLEL